MSLVPEKLFQPTMMSTPTSQTPVATATFPEVGPFAAESLYPQTYFDLLKPIALEWSKTDAAGDMERNYMYDVVLDLPFTREVNISISVANRNIWLSFCRAFRSQFVGLDVPHYLVSFLFFRFGVAPLTSGLVTLNDLGFAINDEFSGRCEDIQDDPGFYYSSRTAAMIYRLECFKTYSAFAPVRKVILNEPLNEADLILVSYLNKTYISTLRVLYKSEFLNVTQVYFILGVNLQFRMLSGIFRKVHNFIARRYPYFVPRLNVHGTIRALALDVEVGGLGSIDGLHDYNRYTSDEFMISFTDLVSKVVDQMESTDGNVNQGVWNDLNDILTNVKVSTRSLSETMPDVKELLNAATTATANVSNATSKLESKLDNIEVIIGDLQKSWTPSGMVKNATSGFMEVVGNTWENILSLIKLIHEHGDLIYPVLIVAATTMLKSFLPSGFFSTVCDVISVASGLYFGITAGMRVKEYCVNLSNKPNYVAFPGTYAWCNIKNVGGKETMYHPVSCDGSYYERNSPRLYKLFTRAFVLDDSLTNEDVNSVLNWLYTLSKREPESVTAWIVNDMYTIQTHYAGIRNYVLDEFDSVNTNKALETSDLFEPLVLLYMAMGVDPNKKGDVVNAVKNFPSFKNGAVAVFDAIMSLVVKLSGWFSKVSGFDCDIAIKMDIEYRYWLKRADVWFVDDNYLTMDVTVRALATLEDLLHDGLALAAKYDKSNNKILKEIMMHHIKALQKVYVEAMTTARATKSTRPEPVGLFLSGVPGTGKTVMATMIATQFCMDYLADDPERLARFKENPKQFIYTRTKEKFYDGLTSDTIVVIHDDVGSTTAGTPEDSKWLELIDEINIIPVAVPMSEADKKGNIHFNNCLTIVTSNCKKIDDQWVVEPGAVMRRLHLPFSITNIGGKTASKADYNDTKMDIYDCRLMKPLIKGWEDTQWSCPLPHLYALVRAKWLSNKAYFDRTTANASKRAAEFSAQVQSHSSKLFDETNFKTTVSMGINEDMLKELRKAHEDGSRLVHVPRPNVNQMDASEEIDAYINTGGVTVGRVFDMPSVDFLGVKSDLGITETLTDESIADYNDPSRSILDVDIFSAKLVHNISLFPTGSVVDVGIVVPLGVTLNLFDHEYTMKATLSLLMKNAIGFYRPWVDEHVNWPSFIKIPIPFILAHDLSTFKLEMTDKAYGPTHTLVSDLKFMFGYSELERNQRILVYLMEKTGINNLFGIGVRDFVPSVGEVNEYTILEKIKNLYGDHIAQNRFVKAFTVRITQAYERLKSMFWSLFDKPVELFKAMTNMLSSHFVLDSRIKIAFEKLIPVRKIRDHLVELSNPIMSKVHKLYEWLKENKAGILAALSILTSGIMLFRHFFPNLEMSDEELAVAFANEENMNQSDVLNNQFNKDNKMQERRNRFKAMSKTQKMNLARSTKAMNMNMGVGYRVDEEIAPLLRKSFWFIVDESGKNQGALICIGKRRFLVPRHYYVSLQLHHQPNDISTKWIIKTHGSENTYDVRMDQIFVVEDFGALRDLMIVDLNVNIPEGRNIISHFATMKESSALFSDRTTTVGILNVKSLTICDAIPNSAKLENDVVYTNEVIPNASIVVQEKGITVQRRDLISYKLTTKQGSCGSLVLSGDKIIGMHISGNQIWGHAARITFEDIVVAMNDQHQYMGKEVDVKTIFPEVTYETEKFSNINMGYDPSCHDEAYPVGIAAVPTSTFTKQFLVAYRGFAEFPPATKFPVNASNKNYSVAREGYKPYPYEMDEQLAAAASAAVGNRMRSIPYGGSFEPYTIRQAIEGVPGTTFKPLDMSTSPGYPENAMGQTQKVFFSKKEDGSVLYGPKAPELLHQIELQFELMKYGIVPVFAFTDQLKMELRKPSKINEPRLISGSNKNMLILMRMVFGPFTRFCCDTVGENSYLIGFNPYCDWDSMEKQYIDYGGESRHGAGDYGGFDKRQNLEIIMSALDCLEHLAGEWGNYGSPAGRTAAMIRRCLLIASVESYHIRGKVIEQWQSSWSSGNACTALVNSVANEWMFVYCFALIKKNETGFTTAGLHAIDVYYDAVFARFLGDDNRFAVREGFEWFNMQSLSKALSTLGHNYTDADKTDDFPALIERNDASMLKRKPFYHEDLNAWFGLIEFDVLINMLRFTVRGKEIEVIKQRGDNALMELALYPKDKWDEWMPKICAWIGPFYKPPHMDYYQARQAVVNSHIYLDENMSRRRDSRTLTLDPPSSTGDQFYDQIDLSLAEGYQRHQPLTNYNQMTSTPNTEIPPVEMGSNIAIESTNVSHNPTTLFRDDTLGYTSTGAEPAYLDRKFVDSIVVNSSQTIVDYLRRPAVLASGAFLSGDSGVLYHADVVSALTNFKIPRVQYLYSIKCDFEFTLQVNADRFQAGLYILGWVPSGGTNLNNGQPGPYYAMHMSNLQSITQLPHVEIDLAKQTSVTLKVPFTSVFPSLQYSTVTSAFVYGMGELFLIPYSPLLPGLGGSTADWTLYASLQNITIGAPSVNQMDEGTKEANAMGVGPVSGVLDKVSTATNIIGNIPYIGMFAKQVSWMAADLAKAARVFGWSKPTNLSAPQRMDRRVMPFSANYDMPSTAKPLGVSSTNSVISHNGVSTTEIDEMSIDYIKSQYAFIAQTTLLASSAVGSKLWEVQVGSTSSLTTGFSKGFTQTPVGFMQSLFTKYRGGFKFRFKFVKTEFARFRLKFVFSPYSTLTNATTYANGEMVYQVVFDASTSSQIEICCPYLLVEPWQKSGSPIGVLSVFVENILVVPTSVANNVPILIEVCATDDMMFAVPRVGIYEPYWPSTNQMADPVVVTDCVTLGPTKTVVGSELAAHTVGETVHSLRQLVKRLTFWKLTATNNLTVGPANTCQIWPYAHAPVWQAAGVSGALTRGVIYADMITQFMFCYAFSTGSVRMVFKVPAATSANSISAHCESEVGSLCSGIIYNNSLLAPEADTTITMPSIEGAMELSIPVWNTLFARSNIAQMTNGNYLSEPIANVTQLQINDTTAAAGYQLSAARIAGDDFSMFRWIGVPAMVIRTAV